jgi:outer membrane protein OmpA-like peptidoglycan-associated protein
MGITRFKTQVRAPLAFTLLLGAAFAFAAPVEVPLVPGVTFVLAVANHTTPAAGAPAGILQGDYEMVVAISEVSADAITEAASFDGTDAAGVQRHGTVPRVISTADLANSRVQILGFHLEDPSRVAGTTSLGPSLDMTRELVQTGVMVYSFRNFVGQDTISGTLRRAGTAPVKFPVILNGKRVELDAVHATGQMALGSARRPFETVILDHPRHPLSLRVAYGPRDGGFPFEPDFAREIVRIDVPRSEVPAFALEADCRMELQGLYFDFNQATLKPQSDRALREIAATLRATPQGRFTIEGHTDNIGSDRYNEDLSARRAASVKAALVRDHGVDAARLSTMGYGSRRPIESNATLAGRARNRRVELICAGSGET